MTDLLQLVYVSSATKLLTEEEMAELLRAAREKNARLGITGLLLYNDGNFIQVLEGPKEAVLKLYETINADPRHKGVTTLTSQAVTERLFPDWSMGFQNVRKLDAANLPGFSAFLDESFAPENFQENPSRVATLLLTFKKMMTR
jgi:hypothetical protein